ncbi:hypothetical protein [Halorubrum sp. CSM-61]|uniref:hypothetical protein n=1 Tax=Halorubrum sp. CSM-61 TaxID=2485838 RepID=UPI000F4AF752|nr:hypothetical protein [Halorubrum sp. CSM-61]
MDFEVPAESPTDRFESRRTDETVVRTAPDRPNGGGERRPEGQSDDDLEERTTAQRREIRRLEAEVERKDEQLRRVTEQYEDLLEEKNRKLAEASDADDDSDRRTTLRSRLAEFLPSLR